MVPSPPLLNPASQYQGSVEEHGESFSSMRESLLSGDIPSDPDALIEAVDWMPRRRLRSSQVIPYFTVEDGTAAAVYFNKLGTQRQLFTLFNFQYPPSCQNSTNKDNLCLFVEFNAGGRLYSANLNMGIALPDVQNPNRVAQLYLYVALAFNPGNKTLALALSVKASGCAVVWELGAGISISITVCLEAKGGVKYNNDSLTFAALIEATITFDVNLPAIGSIIDFTIVGQIGCTAAPKNAVTAYGKLGVRHSTFIAGASIIFDIVASTVDHLPNKWEFSSGVTLSAWINLIFWWPRWSQRYIIWSVGPVTF
ncbi:hypothetical protein FOZ63_024733 [Perkinsus olseni]|uniref:Uncharacterized protein n=1 Tax=Perkinsus olseni TaxID=32597 RepID=A0A7J6SM18_PEROL|nr:hypothetical protein FOZ62_025247 [Perkinsus olseni]KAF4733797.1 hypothetical protein FOZ63_024733 [Perkinsus olseni]